MNIKNKENKQCKHKINGGKLQNNKEHDNTWFGHTHTIKNNPNCFFQIKAYQM